MAGCEVAYVSTLLTISRFESSFSDAIWGFGIDSDDKLLNRYLCKEVGGCWKKLQNPNSEYVNYRNRRAFAWFFVLIACSRYGAFAIRIVGEYKRPN